MENPKIDPARLPELYAAVCQLHASLKLDEVIERTLQAAIKLTNAERAFIKLRGRFALYAFPKLERETERLVEAPFEALVNDIAQNHQTLLIPDAQIDPCFSAEPLSTLFTSRILSIIPLQVQKRLLGVLIVDRETSAGAFAADDLATLAFFTNWASLAIHSTQIARHEGESISIIGSELAQRVTSIKGYTDLLSKEMAGPLNDTQKKFTEQVLFNINGIVDLLNVLSDLTRVETKRLRLEIRPVDLRECTEQVVSKLNSEILKKHLAITLHMDNIPFLRADFHCLVRVMTILLDNAIKYTLANGKIEIMAEVQHSQVKVLIQDTGIGINLLDQAHIFQQWFRADEPLVHEHQGYGLSLYIARNLIELMGGTIGFESEPGKGSTFWFTLPIAEQDDSAST